MCGSAVFSGGLRGQYRLRKITNNDFGFFRKLGGTEKCEIQPIRNPYRRLGFSAPGSARA